VARPLRYTFILALTALGTALAAIGGWRYARASAPVNGPIIVISIDTLRADHLPPYGYRKVRTPAIDALAADGVVFERAYAHAPQTLPAHVSMLSGRLPFETGVRDEADAAVKAGERLLPQLLRERGYTTAGIVSTSLLRRETGVGQGFDFFDAEMPEDAPAERDGAESESIAERWLDQQRSSRVFLFLHLNEPHAPYAPPPRFADGAAPYDGEIAYADDIVGRLTHYLKAHQLYDQSTIVLLSDHGEGLGDHGEQEHGLFVYDEVLHVPFIVKQAANASPGRRVSDLVQQVDLVPTILDLVKAPVPGNLRGRSLRPLLDGTGHPSEQPVYAEALFGRIHFGWSDLTTIFDGRYRYIRAPREELYDVRRDPGERENLADNDAPAQRALGDALDRLAGKPAASGAPAADPKDNVEILETYRAAMALGGERRWNQAIALLQSIVKREPELIEVWSQIAAFAMSIDRYEVAADAYQRVSTLEPSNAGAYLGAASALLKEHKVDEARERAERALEAASGGVPARAAAHALLARIALTRHDAEDAREEAALAREADPTLPMPAFIDGHLLYDESKLEEALAFFEKAIAEIRKAHASPMPELHSYAADTLARLQRFPEAETHYVEELRAFPQNTRARAGLATLYQATDRPDEAGRVLSDLTRMTPTPESYALAARLWKTFGNRHQAEAVRAEARRVFGEPLRGSHVSRP
jgi:arylsulfatase A-like enzyme/thioredoxin-like negative regulator of GroEL